MRRHLTHRPEPDRARAATARPGAARSLLLTLAGVLGALALGGCGVAYRASPAILTSEVRATPSAGPLAISPQNGTVDASPASQISFLGPAGTRVLAIRVTGSASGTHSGALRAYSTGTGESFLPSHPFAEGEQVSVSARISAGGHVVQARTRFTVAHQAVVSTKQFPINPGEPNAVQHYSTAPSLTPSSVRVTTPAAADAAPGDFFLAPYQGVGTAGPMIIDQSGRPGLVPPAARRLHRDQLPACRAMRASRC